MFYKSKYIHLTFNTLGLLRNGPDEAIRAAAELTLANIEPPKSVVVVVMTLACACIILLFTHLY